MNSILFRKPSSEYSVSVVMNVFKRGRNFADQLRAIQTQTHKVEDILVWENGEDAADPRESLTIIRSNKNLGVWARFAAALNTSSDFVWVIDDDTIPGPLWLENALGTFKTSPGVIGSRGLRFRSQHSYTLYDEFGPNNPSSDIQPVDIVGHNWIFPREWLGLFWTEYANKFDSPLAGEDIHLSFAVKKHLGLQTFVPPHPEHDTARWGELPDTKFSGRGRESISQNPKSMLRFEKAYAHYIDLGFSPLCLTTGMELSITEQMEAKLISRFPHTIQSIAGFLNLKKRP